MGSLKKGQPIWSSRLSSYSEELYITLICQAFPEKKTNLKKKIIFERKNLSSRKKISQFGLAVQSGIATFMQLYEKHLFQSFMPAIFKINFDKTNM